jgi:hypothetical protein
MLFRIILAVVAIRAGAVASLASFGIGSLLTPLLAVKTGLQALLGNAKVVVRNQPWLSAGRKYQTVYMG